MGGMPKKELSNNFDFIEAAANGYRLTWRRRDLIWRMMLPVFVVKILSFTLILLMGLEDNFIRQGLVLLPGFFLQGWMLCRLVRIEFYEQATQNDLYAGTALYTLIYTIMSLVYGVLRSGQQQVEAFYQPAEPNILFLFLSVFIVAGALWSVRLAWLFIAAVMGQGLMAFLRQMGGWIMSFTLISTWFLCFLPIGIALIFIEGLLVGLFPLVDGQPSEALQYAGIVLQSGATILIEVVVTLAVATGFAAMISGKPLKPT